MTASGTSNFPRDIEQPETPRNVLVNGEATDSLCVFDRAVQYGDGVFETLPFAEGLPRHWDRHMRRLLDGCRRLRIPPPDTDVLHSEAQQLLSSLGNGVLKIIVTRGSGGRGYRPPDPPSPTRIVSVHPRPDYPKSHGSRGINLRICETRLGRNPRLAGLKHLNRLEQILARSEWNDDGIAEGLMLDTGDCVIEGTMTNVFLVKKNVLITPVLSHCGVTGIMRELVLESADRLGVTARITSVAVEDLYLADELFVTNSVIGLWPVCGIAAPRQRKLPAKRPVTKALDSLIQEL